MKKVKILFTLLLLTICVISGSFKKKLTKNTYQDSIQIDTLLIKETFETKSKFHKVNNTIEDSFIVVFNTVLKTFDLDKHKDLLIAQILVESKGYQYYPNDHIKA